MPSRTDGVATDARQARLDRADANAQASTDTGIAWQWWHLVVYGPADEVASFTADARGPGFIPWGVEDSGFEESVVAFAFGGAERPSLSVADCRILARQFHHAIEARRARNEAQPGRATRCPLDLQALLPVPAALLHLGPRHPEAEAWLRQHWGVLNQPVMQRCWKATPPASACRAATCRSSTGSTPRAQHRRRPAGTAAAVAGLGVPAQPPADDVMLAEPGPDTEEDEAAIGGAGELLLRLDGFAGSLDLLLELARTHRIDLRALDLLAAVEQLIQATRSETAPSLGQKAAWTVTASWLLLRSHLMLPAADPRHPVAAEQARQLQAQLLSLQEAQNLARWPDEQPQLGRDVFGRGASEPGTATQPEPGHLDRVEFLWACIALFDGDWSMVALDLPATYAPRPPDLYKVGEARDRVRQLLRDAAPTVLVSLADLLPPDERHRRLTAQAEPPTWIRHRSA